MLGFGPPLLTLQDGIFLRVLAWGGVPVGVMVVAEGRDLWYLPHQPDWGTQGSVTGGLVMEGQQECQ